MVSQHQTLGMWPDIGSCSYPPGHCVTISSRRLGGERAYAIPIGENAPINDVMEVGTCAVEWQSLDWFAASSPMSHPIFTTKNECS
jgi:hypothetical protein